MIFLLANKLLKLLSKISAKKGYEFLSEMSDEDAVRNVDYLSHALRQTKKGGAGVSLYPIRLALKQCVRVVAIKKRLGVTLFGFEKWIAENERTLFSALSAIKDLSDLPHVNGLPRIVVLADFIVKYSGGKVREERVDKVLAAFQSVTPLTFREIEALSDALRYRLLFEISLLAERSLHYYAQYLRAKRKEFRQKYALSDSYLYAYMEFLGKPLPQGATARDPKSALLGFENILADDETLVARYVASLREIVKIEDVGRSVQRSSINDVFRSVEDYRDMSDRAKREYLARCQKIAEDLSLEEQTVARAVLDLGEAHGLHFGEILFYYPRALRRYLKFGRVEPLGNEKKRVQGGYATAVIFLSLVIALFPAYFLRNLWSYLSVLPLFIAALHPVEYLLKRFLSMRIKGKPLPQMDYERLPERLKTVVVCSRFVANEKDAEDAMKQAETLAASTVDPGIQTVILADFPSSDQAWSEEDEKLADYFGSLPRSDSVSILIRSRVKRGDRYLSWERKRGAILDLFSAMQEGEFSRFHIYGKAPSGHFAVLLDDDSEVLPGTIRSAILSMAHPLNAEYDLLAFGGRINRYSVKTYYSERYLRGCGVDAYPYYSDFYSDAFDCALYCGKAIVRISSYLAKLKDFFPDGRILSHDLIEGAVLRSGSLRRCVYEDAPATFVGDAVRSARWQRGDVMLLPYAFCNKVKDRKGDRVANPVAPIYKLVLFINGFSVLRDAMIWTVLLLAFFSGQLFLGYYAVSCLLFTKVYAFLDSFRTFFTSVRFGHALRGVVFALELLVDELLLSPFRAIEGLYLFVVTSVKMAFHSKTLLEWKPFRTTQNAGGIGDGAKLLLPSVILLSFFSIAAGNLWVNTYTVAVFLYDLALLFSGKRIVKKTITEKQRSTLFCWAKEIYRYFSAITDEGLPTDNIQLFPQEARSNMTSPTNLGFALLAEICAVKLGLISKEFCRVRATALAEKFEKLKKWKGHLFNWYDVKTFEVKMPEVVSTVDSANFVACLTVAERYFLESGEVSLSQRFGAIAHNADFTALYSKSEKAMSIVRYPEREKGDGRYDLLASESRLAYCFSIGQGVDPECYFALGRDFDPVLGNTLLSWSGTAFEYMLPRIFLQAPIGSLIAEQEFRSCLVQRAQTTQGVFGRSECGYWDFNDAGAFRYKAVGSCLLALSDERADVVAPYASFLYLPVAPKACLDNLISLKKKGMEGEYGFYEAMDFEEGGKIVKSYMTHHQGMALAALTNALCNEEIVRLFSSSPRVRATRLLLAEENVHTRQPRRYSCCESTVEESREVRIKADQEVGVLPVRCGEYRAFYDSLGRSRASFKGRLINKYLDYLSEKGGIFVQVKEGDKLFSPTAFPYGDDTAYALFTDGSVTYRDEVNSLSMKVYPLDGYDGELRTIVIENPSGAPRELTISLYSDLVLNTPDAYDSHPAYSDMFVTSEYDEEEGTEYLFRKNGECKTTFAASISVKGLTDLKGDTNAYNVIGRHGSARSDYEKGISTGGAPSFGDVLYPCFGFTGKIVVPAHESRSVYVVMLAADELSQLRERNEKIDLAYRGGAIELIGRGEEEKDGDLAALLKVTAKLLLKRTSKEALSTRYAHKDFFLQKGIDPQTDLICLDLAEDSGRAVLRGVAALSARLDKMYVPHCTAVLIEPIAGAGMSERDLVQKRFEECGAKVILVEGEDRALFRSAAKILFPLRETDREERRKVSPLLTTEPFFFGEGLFSSGEGCFTNEGYRVVPKQETTRLPYANVVGEELGGFVATESGGGFTFGENAREDKITVWTGDALRDHRSEELVLEMGKDRYLLNGGHCEHDVGVTRYSHIVRGVVVRTELSLAEKGSCKLFEVAIAGDLEEARISLSLTLALGWRFCDRVIVESQDGSFKLINATNGKIAYLSCSESTEVLPGDNKSDPLTFRTIQTVKRGIVRFVLSAKEDVPLGKELVLSRAESLTRLSRTAVFVQTGEFALDRLYNRILPYQALSCRLNARTGFYQCGGAIGFRDQLQDCLALLLCDPDRVRRQILLAAAHQYEEGDVQHWWHPPYIGVRTRISDDRLWLVFLASRYVEVTGDDRILDEEVFFLSSAPLAESETSRYEIPKTGEKASLREHLRRAIEVSLSFGEHGLLKIGSGDWNDGLDRVGTKGRGESVWLTMFAYKVITDALPFFGQTERGRFFATVKALSAALAPLLKNGRYPLAFSDDGAWLGYADTFACTLSLNPQTWAVLSGAVPLEDAKRALSTASLLVDEQSEIVKLSVPPFDENSNYGYIAAYPKGVRENGGQYTHAAVWYLKALWECGEKEEGYRLLKMIDPLLRCADPAKSEIYMVEPYVLAGDVYGVDPYRGRGGWTWYTGSAGWLQYTLTEDFFGIKKRGNYLYVEPKFPSCFHELTAEVRLAGKRIAIKYVRAESEGLFLKGKKIEKLDLRTEEKEEELLCHFR